MHDRVRRFEAVDAAELVRGGEVLAQPRRGEAGEIRRDVTVDEVYLLIRGLAQVTATTPTPPPVLARAVDVILAGLST
ncbi:Transcriptional regulator (fragment) [Frankia canadensis]|uniref:Transcriptional regulator n=1 Tax=Frankia canadensis TaxID=1836972 RepID=A0A2I2KK86_9ACTN